MLLLHRSKLVPTGTTTVITGKDRRYRTMAARSFSAASVGPLKLATYQLRCPKGKTPAAERVGLVTDERIWPLDLPYGMLSMSGLIERWSEFGVRIHDFKSKDSLPLADVDLLPPLPNPGNILCVGKNYVEHVKEIDSHLPGISNKEAPAAPIIFTKSTGSLIGHKQGIAYPRGVSEQVDYEGELAVVIGKGGRNISREAAMSHIFGFTICNDVTARDLQKKHQQWFLGKSLDTFCPMGPVVVALPAAGGWGAQGPPSWRLRTWVNGELRQEGCTADLIFDIPALIAAVSEGVSLRPGDILATGTPAGVGAGFSPQRFLGVGDVVKIDIENIGVLENTVVEPPDHDHSPSAD